MSLYNDLNSVLTPYANKIKQNEANVRLALSLEGGGAPIVVSSTSAMTDTEQIYVLSTDGMWYYHNGSAWVAGGTYGAVATDTTLTRPSLPADAKAVGDAIADIEPGLSDDAKIALLDCFAHVAWTDAHGQNYYDALLDALNLSRVISSISAVFTQGSAVIYTDSSLDDLKPHLVVTANYSDATTATVTNYTLSGTLVAGTSTITVSYGGKTATFEVVVTERATLQSITATFTQGSTVIYNDSSLNDLKPHLVVTANYSDATTATVTDYTLSGTLATGISTITVSYGGKTTTFNVTVSERPTLQSITATFTQGSAVIYENSLLNDLKQYLVVTATYSDSTTQTVTDYTLSGTLVTGTSTITVSYGGKTDMFNVTVSARATEPIYKLTNTVEFNGTSDYIDTGLQLLTANKTNLTIVFDILDKTSNTNTNAIILHCMHEAKPYPGMDIYGRLDLTGRSYGFELNSNNGSAGKIYEQNLPSESPVRTKAVWIIDFTSKKSHVHFFINDTSDYQNATITDAMLDVNITENALIGCYQKTDGTKGRYWTGTMYDFKIYDYAWTDAEANAYLQEDHS